MFKVNTELNKKKRKNVKGLLKSIHVTNFHKEGNEWETLLSNIPHRFIPETGEDIIIKGELSLENHFREGINEWIFGIISEGRIPITKTFMRKLDEVKDEFEEIVDIEEGEGNTLIVGDKLDII